MNLSRNIISSLKGKKVEFFTGVPDSLLKNFCNELQKLSKNKHINQVIKGLNIVSSVGNRTGKTDSGWKENLSRIAEAHPRSALAKRYGKKSIKQIKTEQVIKKHSKRIIKNG